MILFNIIFNGGKMKFTRRWIRRAHSESFETLIGEFERKYLDRRVTTNKVPWRTARVTLSTPACN